LLPRLRHLVFIILDTFGTAGTFSVPRNVAAPVLAVHGGGGISLLTLVGQLAADAGGGGISVRNAGDLAVTSLAPLNGVTAVSGGATSWSLEAAPAPWSEATARTC
jgi:hypothetical protein